MQNPIYHNKPLNAHTFLITGGAGFIGSNLVAYLLKHNAKKVIVLDNLSTGKKSNIQTFFENKNFEFIEGDIRNLETCKEAVKNVDFILHQAALGSVPRSINDPITTNDVNVTGFLNILVAAKDSTSLKRFVYAVSSSTYGNVIDLPKIEYKIGKPLSPYAITKYVNELYADVFYKTYDLDSIGLRYFNVFGPNQDQNGAYAAVIPKFVKQFLDQKDVTVNGDGTNSRDFTYIENVVQANLKAVFTEDIASLNQIYNVALGGRVSLNELVDTIQKELQTLGVKINSNITYGPERLGDVKHSYANIDKAKTFLDYNPLFSFNEGIKLTIKSFLK